MNVSYSCTLAAQPAESSGLCETCAMWCTRERWHSSVFNSHKFSSMILSKGRRIGPKHATAP